MSSPARSLSCAIAFVSDRSIIVLAMQAQGVNCTQVAPAPARPALCRASRSAAPQRAAIRRQSSAAGATRRLVISALVGGGAMPAVAAAAAASGSASSNRLLIVGPGVLGSYVGKLWADENGAGSVVGQTNSTTNHAK